MQVQDGAIRRFSYEEVRQNVARIKCRYTKPRCALGNNKECCDRCFEEGVCENYNAPGEYWKDDETLIINYGRKAEHVLVIDDRCENVYSARIEFEKNYKEYKFDEYGLSLGRRGDFIPVDDIEYLEIDDRILVNEEVKR